MVLGPQEYLAGVRKETTVPSLFEKEYTLKRLDLEQLIFAALCCDCGLIAKKLIGPAANFVTELLHIPGGIATSFSLMFLVVAAATIRRFGCATIMGIVQSLLAFTFGMTGSMGALAPIGYILPGIVIDVILYISYKKNPIPTAGIVASSIASSICACLVANILVFNLGGIVFLVYASVAATSGAICSLPAFTLTERLIPILQKSVHTERKPT